VTNRREHCSRKYEYCLSSKMTSDREGTAFMTLQWDLSMIEINGSVRLQFPSAQLLMTQ
jgi:hypothetical protein